MRKLPPLTVRNPDSFFDGVAANLIADKLNVPRKIADAIVERVFFDSPLDPATDVCSDLRKMGVTAHASENGVDIFMLAKNRTITFDRSSNFGIVAYTDEEGVQ